VFSRDHAQKSAGAALQGADLLIRTLARLASRYGTGFAVDLMTERPRVAALVDQGWLT
jgi:hypothetical protein